MEFGERKKTALPEQAAKCVNRRRRKRQKGKEVRIIKEYLLFLSKRNVQSRLAVNSKEKESFVCNSAKAAACK